MENKHKILLSLLLLPILAACTSQSLYEVSNEVWCNHQDNTELSRENEIYPGQNRTAVGAQQECNYPSFEEHKKQKKELETAVAKQKRKDNM